MIKRPLVIILSAYLAGMYLAWQGLPIIITIILVLIFCLLIFSFLYKVKNKFICRQDRFLWCLPVLLLLGYSSMKGQLTEPKLNEAFDQKIVCELSGHINMIVKKSWGKALYVKNITVSLSQGERYPCENVIVFCYDEQKRKGIANEAFQDHYLVGNQITVRGTLKKFSEATNPGQFNEKRYYQIENIDFKMEASQITVTDNKYSIFHVLLDKLKDKLLGAYESILSEKESGTIIAMLLGEKYLLDDEIKQLYQVNGISHVLAISGLHVSLIGMFIFYLLKKLKIPVIPATFLTIFVIYSYGVLTNFSVSTNRAVVMMTVMLIAGLFGKTYDMLSSLSLSALIILLQNPLQIMSAGFLLSFGAVLGIALIYPCLQKLFPSKNEIISSLYISLSAQTATTPFILWYFYQFPTYSLLTNLIILPFVSVLTLTSILAGVAGAVCKPIGIFLIGGANYILKFYELVCRVISSLPVNLITTGKPDIRRMLLYLVLIIAFVWSAGRYQKKCSILLLFVPLLILLLPTRSPGLAITMLDVGQGDSLYMESRSGTTYLIDGGSSDVTQVGNNRIQPFLLSQGTDCLDYAVMTHSDSDHISGLTELIQTGRIKIRQLILPDIGNKDEAYLALEALAQEKHINIQYIKTGDYIIDGSLQILCLHPYSGYEAASSNAYSTTLSVSYGDFDILLTGDLQTDGEEMVCDLLENEDSWKEYFGSQPVIKPVSDYEVLKVAHHGSKFSSGTEFLRLIQPEISLISCGRDNFYGHPHKELLTRLENIDSKILITDETGAITIKTNGKRMVVAEYRKN